MAALVQAFPAQQTATTVSLLQTRPQSASGTLQASSQIQSHSIMQQRSMSSYGPGGGNNNTGYRSYSGSAPVAPYAFTSTPGLTNGHNKQPWTDNKSPAVRQLTPEETRIRYPVSDTSSSSSSVSSDPPSRYHQSHQHQATTLMVRTNNNGTTRPTSMVALPSPPILPPTTPSRPSPDRYRRKKSDSNVSANSIVPSPVGSAMPSGSGMAAVGAHYTPIGPPGRTNSPVTSAPAGGIKNPIGSYTGQLRSQSVDDIHTHSPVNRLSKKQIQQRRASVGAFSPGSLMVAANNGQGPGLGNHQLPSFAPQATNQRPHAVKGSAPNMVARRGSNDSSASAKSSSSHSHRPNSSPNNNTPSSSPTMPPVGSHEINLAHVPPRDSSHLNKRSTAPSPLSKPTNMNTASDPAQPHPPQPRNGTSDPIPSTAAERLAALSADPRKGLKNRLRRAFSFGSAAELRKAAAGNSGDAAERIRLRQERFREEQQAEQSKIAQQQEASGLGEGIYSNGQGHFFSGSTDNLSVSSTASSASIMIRKMGKGMKKSTRSLVGLFRPRSVIGVEAASGPVGTQPTAAQVTMVNVEADKGKTNNVSGQKDESTTSSKGTGVFDAAQERPTSAVNGATAEAVSRRGGSFIGGDQERAEVLAAVKKGILKRQGSLSPVIKPMDTPTGQLPHVPQISSSLPPAETGRRSPAKHQRDNSLTIEGEDYFMKSPRFAGKTPQSAPPSPSGGKGNVTFSPRITFHDTWPSGEYDRRGEISTCNRLTPALAQQIKEELNTFKMEMNVHEESKIYTHFF